MSDKSCITIDTKAFDAVYQSKDKLISDYNTIVSDYDKTITDLLNNWEGKGARAFKDDATKIKTNIGHIQGILKEMCDTLTDCRAVIAESDTAMGDFNTMPFSEQE